MSRILVCEFLTLDGVAQAPGGVDEDRDGGFQYGGWHMAFVDDSAQRWLTEGFGRAGGFLLGRRTYEIFASYWPTAPAEEAEAAKPLNELPKYVVSNTLSEPLGWQNSTLLAGDVGSSVRALRDLDGKDLLVFGSLTLVRALGELALIDEYWLMIDPVTLGGGKRMFGDNGARRDLRLIDVTATSAGSLMARYTPAAGA